MRSSRVTDKARKLLDESIHGGVQVAWAWTAELRSVVPPQPLPQYGQFEFDNGNVFPGMEAYRAFSRRNALSVFLASKSKPGALWVAAAQGSVAS
jgi:hypothetical protein